MSQMDEATERMDALVGALTSAFISTAEVAAERLSLAAQVARIKQRGDAFAEILEGIDARKLELVERRKKTSPAMGRLLTAQYMELERQEEAIVLKAYGEPPADSKPKKLRTG